MSVWRFLCRICVYERPRGRWGRWGTGVELRKGVSRCHVLGPKRETGCL